MKKIYIFVLSAVTVFCVILGTLVHVGGWLDLGFFPFGGDSGSSKEYSEEQPGFRSLDIDAAVMSVTIQKGDRYHISYKASENLIPKMELKGETLVVTQPSTRKFWKNILGNKKCEMTITIPEGTVLNSAKFDFDVGNLIVSDLSSEQTKVSSDVGNVELTSCRGNRLEAESDVGNIEIRSSEFKDTQIDTDVGNVYFSAAGNFSEYNVALATDLGKVTVDGNKLKRNFSQTASAASSGRRLTVETDTGNIEITTSK